MNKVHLTALFASFAIAGISLGRPCDHIAPPPVTDTPDSAFADSNADGIDGMACGPIFVDVTLGADGNPGTMALPMKTIGAAALAARAMTPIRAVYVSKGIYMENVVFVPGVSVYGGYDRAAAWGRSLSNIVTVKSVTTTPAYITDPSSTAPGATVIDMITFDGTGQAPGALNAAVVVRNMNAAGVTFTTCTFKPGAGIAGTAGTAGTTGASGSTGFSGANGDCDDDTVNAPGGNGGPSPASGRNGGAGGSGGKGNMNGGPGQVGPNSGGTAGGGGNAADPGQQGGNGGAGAVGAQGTNGRAGQPFVSNGQGGTGTVGLPGFGGGGGGGGGGQTGTFVEEGTGNGGGGGGGAGNGGSPGAGGGGGGSSIGVYVQTSSSAVALSTCQFTTLAGGAGGPGGAGGAGGTGADGGLGGGNCVSEVGRGGPGGKGGNGGSGGPGGGGAGGSSIGILMFGAPSVSAPGPTFMIGSAGSGGGGPGLPGVNGVAGFISTAPSAAPISLSSIAVATHARLTAAFNTPSAPTRAWHASQSGGASLWVTTGALAFGASPNGTPSSSASGEITFTPTPAFSGWTSFTFSFSGETGTAVVYVAPPAFADCNGNGINDATDIVNGTSLDCDANAIPDECSAPAPTTITLQPNSQAVQINTPATFAITASGPGTLGYQWRRNGLPLSDGMGISGATASILNINPATLAWQGSYDCIVTSSCGSAASLCVALLTQCKADFDENGNVEINDIFVFLNAWFSGCP